MPANVASGLLKYKRYGKKLFVWVVRIGAGFLVLSVVMVVVTRFVPVLLTPLMVIRLIEGGLEGGNGWA